MNRFILTAGLMVAVMVAIWRPTFVGISSDGGDVTAAVVGQVAALEVPAAPIGR